MIKNILIGTVLVLMIVASAGATEVRVDPASQTVASGDPFHVDVVVEDVVNMTGDAAILNFDPGAMQVTGITEGAFLKTGGSTLPIVSWDNTAGTATFAYALMGGTPVTGSGILATIQFSTNDTEGTYDLTLTNVELRDANNELIPRDVVNGTVTIPTEVRVDPASQTILAGNNFQVDVVVVDVVDLKGDAATLNFDPGAMQVTGITEGDFLKTGGSTLPIASWDNTAGTATFAYALWGTYTPVSGSGTLATIQFSTNDTEGTYDLSLTGVELRNASNGLIPTDVVDGNVTIERVPVQEPVLCTDPDPPSHDFGDVPEGQARTCTFNVTNCGTGGTLTWGVNDDQQWIEVNPISGTTTTETDTVAVTIDTTGLNQGLYTGTINVTSNGGVKEGTITVDVVAAPTPTPTPPPPVPVPVLSGIGMIALIAALAVVLAISVSSATRRRKK